MLYTDVLSEDINSWGKLLKLTVKFKWIEKNIKMYAGRKLYKILF